LDQTERTDSNDHGLGLYVDTIKNLKICDWQAERTGDAHCYNQPVVAGPPERQGQNPKEKV
jgi:hypothetical protein